MLGAKVEWVDIARQIQFSRHSKFALQNEGNGVSAVEQKFLGDETAKEKNNYYIRVSVVLFHSSQIKH